MDEFSAGLVIIAVPLFALLGGTCIHYVNAATRLREELARRDAQIKQWGFYFFRQAERGVTWPDILAPIGRESFAAGSLLAWLACSRRISDIERLLMTADHLNRNRRNPRSLEEWRSLGSADLGDEFLQTALIEIAKILREKSWKKLGVEGL